MGKRGPQPKSAEMKALEGNPGKKPLRKTVDEEDVSSGGLRMPQRLTEDERIVWHDTLESMPAWWFRAADKVLLMAYCRAVVRWNKSESALHNKSSVDTRANGSPCINPHIVIINTALDQVMKLSEVLALTRSKRKGMLLPDQVEVQPEAQSIPVGDEPEDFAGLLKRVN